MEQKNQQNKHFDALLKANPDLMFIFDSEYKIIGFHANDQHQLYADPNFFLQKKIKDVLPHDVALITHKNIDKVLQLGQSSVDHYSLRIADEDRYFECRYVHSNDNEVLAIVRDVSSQKKAEIANKELQNQLLQAQKLESIGRLAGGIAHDYNNMLTIMYGYLDILMKKKNDPILTKKIVQELVNITDKSADLTKQLLTFARKQKISPKKIELNDALGNIITLVRKIIGENINLTYIPNDSETFAFIDPSQLDQIIMNLCVNAKDAIDGIGTIEISVSQFELLNDKDVDQSNFKAGSYAKITVTDSGCGIAEDTMLHIFEPFFTTKEEGKGTGLGLSTVYGAVQQNNGFIEIASKINVGTTFDIFFPLHNDDANEKTANEDKKDYLFHNKSVMVVEDDETLLELIKQNLELTGLNVHAFLSAKEAVQFAKNNKIDLLVTDIIMPHMNGIKLFNVLSVIQPEILCIFMSGYCPTSIKIPVEKLKFYQFLQKPFAMRDLRHAIQRTFRESLKNS